MSHQADILPLFTAMTAALADHDRLQDLVARSSARRGLGCAPGALAAAEELAVTGAPIRSAMIDWLMAQWVTDTVLATPAAEPGWPRCISLAAMVEGAVPRTRHHDEIATAWTDDWADGEPVRIPVRSAETLWAGLAMREDLAVSVLDLMALAGLHVPEIAGRALRIADHVLSAQAGRS